MRFATSTSLIAIAAVSATTSAAIAQQYTRIDPTQPDTTPANVNVLNLLSPFLSLNSTPTGQATLQTNLNQTIAINNAATPQQRSLAISDKNLPGNASNSITGLPGVTVGPGANLAGGLPPQPAPAGSTVIPQQSVGGYGQVLGPIFQRGTAPGGPLTNTINLLVNSYAFTSADLGVAKNYFANGAATNTANASGPQYSLTARAPAGFTLPTFSGLPNTTNSVLDIAAGVTATQAGQDIYGSSRPVQARPTQINQFDPTALNGLATNPSFPSGHTNYAYNDSILLGMLTPSLYQSMLVRASEYGNSRIVLGVHYPLDIIASRAFTSYELAQAFTNPLYINNASYTGSATTGFGVSPPAAATPNQPIDLPTLFKNANAELAPYLAANCGAAVATCAASPANTANDPYVPSEANRTLYRQRLTYGLPTLTFAQAPVEVAPAGGPDASILLAPIFGGDTAAAKNIAPTGGINGTLATGTINQIIVNTETNALAAFYGTPLSYWSRIDLYSAAGYFGGTNGTLTLAPTDRVNVPVTIGGALGTGTLYGNGATITGNVTTLAGSTFGGGSAKGAATTTIVGYLTMQPGSVYAVTVTAANAVSSTNVKGTATVSGSKIQAVSTLPSAYALIGSKLPVLAATSISGTFTSATLTGTLSKSVVPTVTYGPTGVTLAFKANTITSRLPKGASQNQLAAGRSINAVLASGKAPPAFVRLFTLPSKSLGQALSKLSGEIATTQVTTTVLAGSNFLGTLLDPNIEGRGGAPVAGTTPFLASVPEAAQFTGQVRYSKDGPAPVVVARPAWSVWATGTGLNADLGGDKRAGSHNVSEQLGGIAVGADYRAVPGLVMGFGLGGASTWAKLDGGLGSATSNIFQVGAYASQKFFNSGYLSGALAYSNADGKTSRIANVGGVNGTLTGKPNTNLFGGRVEAGFRYGGFGFVGLTPYAAVEVQNADTGAYAETASGAKTFALRYSAKTNTNLRVEGGARFDVATTGFGSLFGRVAYVHQDLTPSVTGLFEGGLAATPFTINGAKLPTDAALVALGSDVRLGQNVKLTAQALGELAPKATTVTGRLTLKYEF